MNTNTTVNSSDQSKSPSKSLVPVVEHSDAQSSSIVSDQAETPVRGRGARVLAALTCAGLAFGAGALGSSSSSSSGRSPWYRSLRKSKANPPSWVFGPVWTGLYSAIAYSGYRVWRQPPSPERTRALQLWGAQMALNAAWTPLFFGAHRPKASAAVATALVPAVAGYIANARKVDKKAAWLMVPYLGWSSFAAFLNAQIVRKNAWRL